jgi:hypothetical protein
MIRKIKALSLALVAVFAMSALSASVASAEFFHSEVEHTTLDGTQVGTDVFTVKAGTVSCGEAKYTGTTTSKTVKSITVFPTYSECTAFGFVSTKIDVPAGCGYTFTPTGPPFIHIVGCNTTPITVTAFNCWVTVKDQSPKGTVAYVTGGAAGATHDIEVQVSLEEITYQQHNKNFPFCTGGAGIFNDGKYTGKATVIGTDTAGNQVGITATT